MKAQHQTIIGNGENGEPKGNCFATCVACLLDLDVSAVPNFCAEEDGRNWWRSLVEWLAERGFSANVVGMGVKGSRGPSMARCFSELCIVSGKSPRGEHHHSVIGRMTGTGTGSLWELVHDPAPSGDGLDGEPLDFIFLVPNDPSGLTQIATEGE